MLRNMLGQIFDSTLDRFGTQPFSYFWPFFPFSKDVGIPIFIVCFHQNNIFVAHPKKVGTLFVNQLC